MQGWMYFGCYITPGHHLHSPGMGAVPTRYQGLSSFDGALPPQDSWEEGVATVTRLEGWSLTALAFWDYSVDKRSGSNSIVFAPGLTIPPDELLCKAAEAFPQVFRRFKTPVRLKTQGN